MTRVRVVTSGDSQLYPGRILELEEYLSVVRLILVNGGEMPVAVPYPFDDKEKV